jgi:hypothetical protein
MAAKGPKVPEIKAELRSLGYCTTGKKADLIWRLATARVEVGMILAQNRANGLEFVPLAGSSSTDGVHSPGTLDDAHEGQGQDENATEAGQDDLEGGGKTADNEENLEESGEKELQDMEKELEEDTLPWETQGDIAEEPVGKAEAEEQEKAEKAARYALCVDTA